MAGRPSTRDERYVQVMEALVRCVARLGVEGATLSAIAAEAGLTRPLIRHHLGNRDDILRALQGYVLTAFDDQTQAMAAALPQEAPASALVELLFSEAGATDPALVLAFAALTARAVDDPTLARACRASVERFEAALAQAIRAEQPGLCAPDALRRARGLAALYFNAMSLAPLGLSATWQADAKANALTLTRLPPCETRNDPIPPA